MSDCCIVHGYIEEAWPANKFGPQTDAVIAALPLSDTWPPFARPMVAVTGPDDLSGSMRGSRLILVGGSMNYLYDDFAPWLDKLERFLSQLIWLQANLFFEMGCMGVVLLNYRAKFSERDGTTERSLSPPAEWSLRCLDFDYGNSRSEWAVQVASQRRGYTARSWNQPD